MEDKANGIRQRNPRYPFLQTVTFEVSAPFTSWEAPQGTMEGSAQNVSEGGICFITEQALEEAQIIKVKIPILDGDAVVPTLAKVQWVKKKSADAQESVQRAMTGPEYYTVGLCFLF